MTNTEFIAGSLRRLELLQRLGHDADWHASSSLGMSSLDHATMCVLVKRGLATYTAVVANSGMRVSTCYKITATGWLLIQGKDSEQA